MRLSLLRSESDTLPVAGATVLAVALLVSACSPSLYPLYRDYAVKQHAASDSLEMRLENALAQAGWVIVPGVTSNVVATSEREIRDWVLYKVVVSIEAIPVGGGYVRLLVHPYRKYLWGTRSKVVFMTSSVRSAVLKDLDAAMADERLMAAGTGVSRDRASTH